MKLFVKPEWSRQQQHRRRLAVERWSLPPPQLRRDVQEAEAAWGRQAALSRTTFVRCSMLGRLEQRHSNEHGASETVVLSGEVPRPLPCWCHYRETTYECV